MFFDLPADVAGDFTMAGGVPTGNVVRWDGNGW